MRFTLFSAITATLLTASTVTACANHGDSANLTPSEQLEIGNDGAADPATLGYNINHVALNVHDLNASMHFYGEVLGMRHIYTFHISPALDLVYMGFSVGGKNGTQYQTGPELYRQKTNTAGIIELLHRKDCDGGDAQQRLQPSTRKPNTMSHIGLIVPDMMAAQERMKKFGVKIIKEIGQKPSPRGAIANAFGVGDVTDDEAAGLVAGMEAIGFQFALAAEDPDGNLIEVLPMD